ncbi:protein MAIN-LIKE 1-like [Arachis duranensis]|uniref:Protein MAIN-LIKE 1-like n=1 Tax=Arachis duranensis TaxID=130453 RepID=A0A6P4DIU6_ARADU|nr:protein MAIN-LIKE 1-like [Arachis duranensis]
MTITLQDVAYQLGFRIDGDLVSGQPQTKWTVKLTWFLNIVCGELEQDATKECLLRWLPLLEDLDACDKLSWGSAVLAWMYRQMCRVTDHGTRNLGGCISLLLSWAYHHIPLLRPDGFDTCWFPLVERWVQYWPNNARGEGRLRHYRRILNWIGMLYVDCTPSGAIFRSTIVRLIFRLTGPLNRLSSIVSTDDPWPPKSTRNTDNSNR